MNTPSRETCLHLLKQRAIPQHVIVHCLQVDRVARYLAQALNAQGETLDLMLVEAASLLHDITKIDGLQSGENHAVTGAKLLRELGYPRVAQVVSHHIVLPTRPLLMKVTEEEVVNYADKRVMHDRIVTLQERFEDLQRRYGNHSGSETFIQAALERARETEGKIFRRIGIRPEEMTVRLMGYPRS
jgi:putative nucleotidyltransferase with HDIG domain